MLSTTTDAPVRLSPDEARIRRKLRDDFRHYSKKCLSIRTKSGTIAPLTLNRSQIYLHDRLEEQRRKTGMVRALVLKGRQVGISTYIGGRFYWRISHKFGFRAFILTHLDAASDNLFEMAKRFHEGCPALVRPETGKANAKELSFPRLGSGYKVATAGSAEVGRSETIQLFHGSEVAFWPNAHKHAAGIQQAIAEAPDTEDIRESTANGLGNSFHAEWKAAERGESRYEAIFIPWFWHEEYARDSDGWTPPPEWAEYQRQHQLEIDQVHWAWRKNRDLIALAGGTTDEPCWMFRQEYPATAAEAFQTSGDLSFILAAAVIKARKSQVERFGPIILGVDPARGGGDKTAIVDRQTRRIGGHVCKVLDNRDTMATVGEVMEQIRRLHPIGLRAVVVDTTGLGAGVYDRLREQVGPLVHGINFGERAMDPKRYANRRAEMWDRMRQWFEDPATVQVPDSDAFQGDVCAPSRGKGATQFNSSGALVLESKDHIRERLAFSPDLGDASALTFAVDFGVLADLDVDEDNRPHDRGVTGY